MSNTIDGIGPSTAGVAGGSRTAGVAATPATNPATSGSAAQNSGDTATVSTVARTLQKLGAAVDQSSGIDTVKVAALQSAIANGTYQPDSNAIASALLATQNEGG